MAKTKTDICNMALGKIGVSKFLRSYDADQTNEAINCRLYFDGALDRALGELPWKFATRTAALVDIGTPPARWGFRYRLPADCVTARRVPFDGSGPTDEGAPFEIVEDEPTPGLGLCCDLAGASLVYTARIANTVLYPQTFIDLLAWSLALDLAAPLSTNAALITSASQGYSATVLRVGARDLNQQKDPAPTAESDFITSRY